MDRKQIPDNYFERLAKNIEAGIHNLEDNVEQDAPLLHKYGRLETYKVPEGYFDSLFGKLNIKAHRTSSIRRLIPYSVAASIAMVFLLSWFWVNEFGNNNSTQLALEDVYDYYIENAGLIDQELIVDLSFEDVDEDIFDFENLSEEDLELYTQEIINEMTDQELLDIL